MDVLRFIGGIGFGLVVGWTTYFILRRAQPKTLSDLSTFIGIIGGSTITALFDSKGDSFVGYAIGLAIGFFAYYIVFLLIADVHVIHEPVIKKSSRRLVQDVAASGIMGKPQQPKETDVIEEIDEVVWGAERKKK